MEDQPVNMCAIGLMSGTSLDGLDVLCANYACAEGKWQYQILSARTYPYPSELTAALNTCMKLSGLELARLDRKLGDFFGEKVIEFLSESGCKPAIIASHGHTVFHKPAENLTLQIGSGANIAAKTRLPVVCDFRAADLALHGQGAPLVPVGDQLLFKDYKSCLNLGGFANVSFTIDKDVAAFDIGPCNIILNRLASRMHKPFDESGKTARTGVANDELLSQLSALTYYHQPYPKSLGREWADENCWPLIEQSQLPLPDLLATFTQHIALETGKVLPAGKCLVTGGGAWNAYLIELMAAKTQATLVVPDDDVVNFKEALIFGLLGVLRVSHQNNINNKVTGSESSHSGGTVWDLKGQLK